MGSKGWWDVRKIDFWSLDEMAERLTSEELEEAVEAYLDEVVIKDVTWPLKAYGWARREVADKDIEGLGVSLAESAEEWLDEEFGGDDNGYHDVLDEAGKERVARAAIEALKAARQAGELSSWQCEVIETREVTEEKARLWCPLQFAEGR